MGNVYKIYGKEFDLVKKIGDLHSETPYIEIDLVAADGERESVFAFNYSNFDGDPGFHYAGGGKYWSAWEHTDGYNIGPAPGAVKMTPAEFADHFARRCAEEADLSVSAMDGIENRADLIDEVRDWLYEQYKEMIGESLEQYASNRLEEEEAQELDPAQFTLGVAQDYGVPCLIARSGDERHTLIVNIYKVVRDPNYNRDAVKAECKERFNLPNCVYDEDQLDYLLSEIEDKISEENEAAD